MPRTFRDLLDERAVTPDSLASRLGVSPAAVYCWRAGMRLPRPRLYGALAAVLGVTPRALLAALREGVRLRATNHRKRNR